MGVVVPILFALTVHALATRQTFQLMKEGKVPNGLRTYLRGLSDEEMGGLVHGVRVYGFAVSVVLAIFAVLIEMGAF